MGPRYVTLLWKYETGMVVDREGKAMTLDLTQRTVRSQWNILSRGVEGWDFTTVERMV